MNHQPTTWATNVDFLSGVLLVLHASAQFGFFGLFLNDYISVLVLVQIADCRIFIGIYQLHLITSVRIFHISIFRPFPNEYEYEIGV